MNNPKTFRPIKKLRFLKPKKYITKILKPDFCRVKSRGWGSNELQILSPCLVYRLNAYFWAGGKYSTESIVC